MLLMSMLPDDMLVERRPIVKDFMSLPPEIRFMIWLGFFVAGATTLEDSESARSSREVRRGMKADFFMVEIVLRFTLVAGGVEFIIISVARLATSRS